MHTCLNCNRSEEKTPLITLTFNGENKYICPQCLPLLIHKAHVLADKFPGMEVPPPAEH